MAPFKLLFDLDITLLNLGGIIKQAINYLFHHRMYTVIKRNGVLPNSKNAEKKMYICALGPSLKDVDLELIDGDTIVVNRFFKMGEEYPNFAPTYYVIIDSNFASEELAPELKLALDQYIPKGTIFFLNSQLAVSPVLADYNSEQIYFLSSFSGEMKLNKEYSLDKVLPIFENVVGAALLMSICLGYRQISLLGCDFNSFASTTRNHCYADTKTERWYRMSFELFSYAFAANMHDMIQEYAIKHGVEIVNSTRGSLIDAYPLIIEESLYYSHEQDS